MCGEAGVALLGVGAAASATPSSSQSPGRRSGRPGGSAVTGTVVTGNANGVGNIAELNLDATQIGQPSGLLSQAVEVLRLNTVGGVAPARHVRPAGHPDRQRPTRPTTC